MIYCDSSILLAHLLAEDQQPPASLWSEELIASRLTQYEVWTVVHRRDSDETLAEATVETLGRLALIELDRVVLDRALRPFPQPVRTLDALHLATVDFLRSQDIELQLATYDDRLAKVAAALGIERWEG